jgi:hypothetical protein
MFIGRFLAVRARARQASAAKEQQQHTPENSGLTPRQLGAFFCAVQCVPACHCNGRARARSMSPTRLYDFATPAAAGVAVLRRLGLEGRRDQLDMADVLTFLRGWWVHIHHGCHGCSSHIAAGSACFRLVEYTCTQERGRRRPRPYLQQQNPTPDAVETKLRGLRLHRARQWTWGQLAHVWCVMRALRCQLHK